MSEIQSLLDKIADTLHTPELSEIGFWQDILNTEKLTILKQAIDSKEAELLNQQVDYSTKIAQFLTSEDPSYWQQGIDLLHSLDDEEIWNSVTQGCQLTDKGLFESQHFSISYGLFQAWCENPYTTHEEGVFDFSLYKMQTLLSHLIEKYKWKNPETVLEQALAPLVHFKKLRLSINSKDLRNLGFLKKLPNIIELTTKQERHETLDYSFLESLVNLEHLTMQGNVHIETLQPLSGLVKLKSLNITLPIDDAHRQNLSVTDLSPLSALSELQTVSLQKMKGLASLNGLQNAQKLQTLSLSYLPSLTALDGINTNSLTDLNITRCETLHNISALLGAPCLTDISINGHSKDRGHAPVATRIASLDGLSNCPELRRLHFSKAGDHLINIDGLQGCPKLEEFTMSPVRYSNPKEFTNINALSHCTELREISILEGRYLNSFPDLRRCSKLERIEINNAQFPNIDGLQGCPALKTVVFKNNRKLLSIAGLTASHNLEEIHIPGCTTLEDIGDLPKLSKLHTFNLSTNGYTPPSHRFTKCASESLQPCPPKDDGMLVTRDLIEGYQDKIRLVRAIQNNERATVEAFVDIKYLDLHGLHSLTQPGLLQLLTNLEHLNLKDCSGLPFKSWQKVYSTTEKVAAILQKIAKRFPLS